IRYMGVDGNDTLTVATGPQDSAIRVTGGNTATGGADQVISTSLPPVQFTGLSAFILDPGAAVATAIFVTAGLGGALSANYRFNATANDTLVIEGTGGNDTFTVTNPSAAVSVAVAMANSV